MRRSVWNSVLNRLGPLIYARVNKLYLSRLLVIAFTLLLFGSSAVAQNVLYHMRGNAGPGVSNNIWVFNPATGAETLIYANYPGGNAATIAQRSDGMLFYAINATNGDVYRFNPATPNVAPVQLGPIGPDLNTVTNVSGGFRMAFSGNTLYYMVGNAGTDANRLYTVNQTSGRATSVSTLNLTNNGGDIAFNGGTLHIVDQSRNLFTSTTLTGNATAAGTIAFPVSGTAPNTIGISFIGGQLYVQTVGDSAAKTAIWSVSGTNATFINQISGGNSATGDMASASVPAPNLSITKTDNVTSVYRGGPVSYTITVTNLGTYAVTGTVSDSVPASVTVSGWNCATTAPSFCGPPTSGGAGNNINATVTLEPAASATFTVNGTLSATASGTLVNTATVAVPPWFTDSNAANNTATDTDNINLNANLGITKTDGLAAINPGNAISYSIVVSNAGSDASTGSIVTDTVPATITGVTWTCGAVTGGATCGALSGTGNSINTTANLPSGSSVTYTVSGTLSPTATGTLSNTARVITPASGVSDPTDLGRTGAGNNSATDNTTINPVSDVRLAKSHSGDFTVGVNGSYTLTASNSGTLATSGTITVVDNLPAGLTVAAIPAPAGWNCSTTVVGSSTMTCSSSTVIPAGANHPNTITLSVVVAAAAFPSVTNAATISGGGEPASNNGNNSATDPTTVNGVSDVRIAKSHSGDFTVGVNGSYTLTASNSGTLATSGTITVIDNLPTGLTLASVPVIPNWNCGATVVGSSTMTCTSATAIPAGANHPNTITLSVVVAPAAFPSVTNAATISGGGEPAYNNGNNSASDPTTVNGVPDLTITKTHTGNFTQGQIGATYSITATNSGNAITSGTVTVTDALPAGLNATDISGPGWTCVLGPLTCTRNDALAVGLSYPAITLTVDVSLTAPASVTNTATVSGGGENNASNNTANNPTTINAAAPPNITLDKSVSPGGTQNPGTDLLYAIVYTNTGGQPANNFIIIDPNMANVVPAERVFRNVDFKLGSITSSPGSTGLLATFEYSNDGGTTWTYTPVSGAGGAPAGYDRLTTNVRFTFTGSLSQTAPNNAGSVGFTVRIR